MKKILAALFLALVALSSARAYSAPATIISGCGIAAATGSGTPVPGALVVNGLPLTQATPPDGFPSGILVVAGVSKVVTLQVAQGTSQIQVIVNGQPAQVSSLSGPVSLRGGLIVNT